MLAAMTAVMAACSSDNDISDNAVLPGQQTAQVKLHISPANNPAVTRTWQDGNAVDAEMMNIWVVVITTDANVVEKVIACKPTGDSREIDPIATLPLGTHKFYSFANMSVATVASTLGISVTMPTMTNNDEVYEATAASGTVDADKSVTVSGNGFTALTSTGDNGFGFYGIPMSNVQTATITTNTTLDLIVIRMLAKMEIQLFNESNAAVTVQSVTLSDITSNASSNLKLLPSLTSGANTMDYVHKDIQPNLGSGAATAEYTYTPVSAITIPANTAYSTSGSSYKMTFYVNESAIPTNNDGLFYLTLKLSDTEYRYALVSNNTASEWNYIARNDYRIIPLVLDDYKLELVPYDFPPIGVYPCSVKEIESDLYEMTFHDYGHFHLLPKVTKISDNSVVSFSSSTTPSGTAWTLNSDWAGSFKTAATKGGAWLDASGITANGFYRDQTATADADEAGGAPVWYVNDGTAGPQWSPTGAAPYEPFIFGYIADPAGTMSADKQIYHEFRIKLYVGGTYRRDMLYRFYMTLSADQMLYAPYRSATAPRRKH